MTHPDAAPYRVLATGTAGLTLPAWVPTAARHWVTSTPIAQRDATQHRKTHNFLRYDSSTALPFANKYRLARHERMKQNKTTTSHQSSASARQQRPPAEPSKGKGARGGRAVSISEPSRAGPGLGQGRGQGEGGVFLEAGATRRPRHQQRGVSCQAKPASPQARARAGRTPRDRHALWRSLF
ncbi:hypothetical protein J6590_100508 [Homalodisca vitripennis]|nr:hypothetical protein J6590_100508 [Homalodisca vitripennis]